jgi:hypothetical protein
MKQKQSDRKPGLFKRAVRAAVIPLTAGLMFLSCGDDLAKMTSYGSIQLNKKPASFRLVDRDACKNMLLPADNTSSGLIIDNQSKDKKIIELNVTKGDVLWRVDYVGTTKDEHPTKGHFSYDVADVDKAGVLFRFSKIDGCEASCTYFRVNFDGTGSYSNSKLGPRSISVKKTGDRNIAQITWRI